MFRSKGRRDVLPDVPSTDYSNEIPGETGAWFEISYLAANAHIANGKVVGIICRFCLVALFPIWGQHPGTGKFFIRGRNVVRDGKRVFVLPNVCDDCVGKA